MVTAVGIRVKKGDTRLGFCSPLVGFKHLCGITFTNTVAHGQESDLNSSISKVTKPTYRYSVEKTYEL